MAHPTRNEETTIQTCDRLTELKASPLSSRMEYRQNLSRLHTVPAA